MMAKVGSFWEILAQQAIGVFIAAPLPRALRIAEIDVYTGVTLELLMLGHASGIFLSHDPALAAGVARA